MDGGGFDGYVFSTYPQYTDDIIKFTTTYGDVFFDFINNIIPQNNIPNFLKFNGSTDEIDALFASGKWKTHFSSWDGFDKTNNGIQGCHTLSEIKRIENVTQISDKERLIKIIKDDKIADGVYEIEYVIANKKPTGGYETQIINGKEEYVWRSKTYRKTVIDTSIISVDVAEEWAKEAFENSEIIIHTSMRNEKKSVSLQLVGMSDNGLNFRAWIDINDWTISSFYPCKS